MKTNKKNCNGLNKKQRQKINPLLKKTNNQARQIIC